MDTKKIIQSLVYLANYQPDKKIDNMKAYKLLWLADRYHLRQTGRTITGDTYYAMPHGIVPSDAKCLLEGEKTKLRNPKGYFGRYIAPIKNEHQFKVVSEPDLNVFSDSDQDALDKVLEKYNGYSAKMLSQLSHKFPEWLFYKNLLEDKSLKYSYKIDFDHFFEEAPKSEAQLFDDNKELLELTKKLSHQYCRV